MTDRRSKWISCIMVLEKGPNTYAVAAMGREISLSGYNRTILKSDQEPAILNLLKAVKDERSEDMEVILEQTPVGEH